MSSVSFSKFCILFIIVTNLLIVAFSKAHFEPFPFHEEETDEEEIGEEDPNDETAMPIERDPHTQRILSTDGKVSHKDIIRKNLFAASKNRHPSADAAASSTRGKNNLNPGEGMIYDHERSLEDNIRDQVHPQNKETNILKIIGDAARKAERKVKMRYPVKVGHVCPEEGTPRIGDKITLHVPSREHLVPRFTGMRVFAPPHAEYHESQETGFRDQQHVFDHHTKSKLLYVFDEHVIQGVWPVHDTMFMKHRNLKVVVNDIHVQDDPNEVGSTLNVDYTWDGGQYIYFTLDSPTATSTYSAFGIADGAFGMNGRAIVCKRPTSGATTTICEAFTTFSSSLGARSDPDLLVTAASADASRASVTFRCNAASLGVAIGSKRIIYAVGSWTSTSPDYHNSRSSQTVTFAATPTTTTAAATTSTSTSTTSVSSSDSQTASTTTTEFVASTSSTTTSMVASTTSMTPIPTTTTSASSSIDNLLSNNLDLDFSWENSFLYFTMTSPANSANYFSIALAPSSASGMGSGVGVACRQPASAATTPAQVTCKLITTTSSFNVAARNDDTNFAVVESSIANGKATVKVRMGVTPFGSILNTNGSPIRMIFAIGSWNTGTDMPSQHSGSGRGATTIVLNQMTTTGAGGSTAAPFTQAPTTPAPPTTTTAPTTAAPTPAPGAKEATSLGGTLQMAWEFKNSAGAASTPASIATDNITITLQSTTSDTYKAVVWASAAGGMGPGTGFACIVVSATGVGKCRDISTSSSYTVSALSASEQVTRIVSSSKLAAGGWKMQITTTQKALNASYKNGDGSSRMLFATGSWDTSNDLPGPHSSDSASRAAAFVNWNTGGVTIAPENSFWRFKACLGICFCLFILLGILGAMLKSKHETSGPKTVFMMKVFGILCVLGSFVACFIAAFWDFEEFAVTDPIYRAFGAASCYFFSILLLPTTKLPTPFNIGYFAGSSYERQILLHVMTGLLIFIFVLVHAVLMIIAMTKSLSFGAAILVTTGKAPLFAFIGLIMLFLMAITGLMRRKIYAIFRYTHLLFPAVLTLFCLHFPLLLAAIMPGIVAYVLDFSWRILTQCWANTQLVSVNHNTDCGVTQLRVRVTDDDYEAGPGQFALVTCYSVSPIAHPFTIARFDHNSGDLTFYIKNLGGPFTKKFSELAAAGQITSVSVSRPIGQLGIRLDASPVLFLCAGGIGITPILSIATHIGHQIRQGNMSGLHTVHIIWSVREDSLIEMITPELLRCIGEIELRGVKDQGRDADDAIANMLSDVSIFSSNRTAVNCAVYQTSGRKGGAAMRRGTAPPSAAAAATREVAAAENGGDADLDEILLGLQEEDHNNNNMQVSPNNSPRAGNGGNNDSHSRSLVPKSRISRVTNRPKFDLLFGGPRGEGLAVSVFSCGPSPFMAEVKKHAVDYDCLIHEETFEM